MLFKPLPQRSSVYRWTILGILIVGVWLRWASLGAMNTMTHYDEAYNALDATNVLSKPQLRPFFPGNFGRESGFVYWLLPFVCLFNGNPLALRLAATIIGILTLAATYKLARELLGPQGAIWSLAALAILYWHVHLSHQALRGNLYVLVGTLSAAWLMRAYRTNAAKHWAGAGIATGLLVYTYFASVFWVGYAFFVLLAWFLSSRKRRNGIILSFGCAIATAFPMLVYVLLHPEYFFDRPQTVVVLDRASIVHNLQLWGKAWFEAGDPNAAFNLPGRPILGPYLGILWGAGLIGMFFFVRQRWQAAWLIGWAVLACLPSLVSDRAPHFLRAAGLTVPTALIIGAGAWAVAYGLCRWGKTSLVKVVPLLILVLAGKATYSDFHQHWINHPETFILMEQPLNQAINLIRDTVSKDAHVYFSPLSLTHPVIGFRSVDLAPRPIAAFDSHQCLVIPDNTGVYVSLTTYEPGFQKTLSQWLNTTVLYKDPGTSDGRPRYSVFWAEPREREYQGRSTVATFGDLLQVRAMRPISKTAQPGATIPIVLGIKPERTPENPLSLFVHLYGDPTPYEGGRMWTQADSQICATYPATQWRTDETIIQSFTLSLPPDIPPGIFTIAVGVYFFPNGNRLPVTEPASSQHDYLALEKVVIQ